MMDSKRNGGRMNGIAVKSSPSLESSEPSQWLVVARVISTVVHPIALPLITLGALTAYTPGGSLAAALGWMAVGLVVAALPIMALVGAQVARGHWTDIDVSMRRQRYLLYPFSVACLFAAAVVLALLRAPGIAVKATLAVVTANMVNGLINLRYKVSAHATTAALCAVLLWRGLPTPDSTFWGGGFSVAALLVGWSRVKLGRHTTRQVILGWVVGVVTATAALLVPWSLAF
jgi:membrane-associated phospholipid phosphatase